jgi:hypothetical protein
MAKSKYARAVLALSVVACGNEPLLPNLTPLAGGAYHGALQNGAVLSFSVVETPDAKLTGSGELSAATAGVDFQVSGTVRGDSVKLTMLRTNGDTATLRAAFATLNRLSIRGRFVSFGGYTENALSLTRSSVQESF